MYYLLDITGTEYDTGFFRRAGFWNTSRVVEGVREGKLAEPGEKWVEVRDPMFDCRSFPASVLIPLKCNQRIL